jgi:ABC-2 type transport system permease protein
MLKALIKARLSAMFNSIFRGTRAKKKRSSLIRVLIGLIALYVIGNFLMIFGLLFNAICAPLHQAGLDWLYFALIGIIAFGLLFAGSVLMTQSQLFEAKDNELLLAMPIPPRLILLSRMVMLLVVDYIMEILIVVPAGVVYCRNAPVSPVNAIFFITAFLFLPLLSMSFSCFFGWLIALISSKVRNKSLVVTSLSICFMLAYLYTFSKANEYAAYLIANGASIAEAVRRAVFPAYHLGKAIAAEDPMSLLLFVLCAAVPFTIVYLFLSVNFIHIATTRSGAGKAVYKELPLRVSRPVTALVRKELRHFFTNPMYILNAGMGVVFTFIFPIAMSVNRDLLIGMFTEDIPGMAGMPGPFAILVLGVLSSLNFISAPSISLEGKNLWIAQSSPVTGGAVLLSKAYAHMIVCLPSIVFAAVVLNAVLEISTAMRALMLIAPALLTVFNALLGVVVNLRFPRFDWISETTAIKQGVSTLVVMFGNLAIVASTAILYGFVLKDTITVELYIALFSLLIAAASTGLYIFLKTKGSDAFAALSY